MRNEKMMNEYIPKLANNPLFAGIQESIGNVLVCANAQIVTCDKNEIIIREQSEVKNIGVVLKGSAQASMLESSGKRFILAHLSENSIFGEVLAVGSGQKSPVTVTATEPVTVLLIPFAGVISGDKRLLKNLLSIISDEYFDLQERINCIIKPTLREKILFYLNRASERSRNTTFYIPFDREGLAGYLNAERSAVSRELSAMKKEGIIDYHKNAFKLL